MMTDPVSNTTGLVSRIRDRPNDAPMETERLLDDAADEIDRLRAALTEIMRGKGEARAWVIANEALKNV